MTATAAGGRVFLHGPEICVIEGIHLCTAVIAPSIRTCTVVQGICALPGLYHVLIPHGADRIGGRSKSIRGGRVFRGRHTGVADQHVAIDIH